MNSYIRQLTFKEILNGSFSLYTKNFFTLIMMYTVPLLPVALLQLMALEDEDMALYGLLYAIQLLLITVAYAAITITLSDICVGNKPSAKRAYKYILGPVAGKLLGTNIIQIVAIVIGFILLIIPGLVFMIWFVFVPIVVVLENITGIEALKRSKNIGAKFYFRIAGLMLTMTIIFAVFGGLVGGLLGVLGLSPDSFEFNAILTFLQLLCQPIVLIMLVLTYYDIRARKEAYDTSALTEDLQH